MDLVKELASDVKRYRWWKPQTSVVIAVSTGIDSMVLLHLLEALRCYQPHIIVAHVNHELRSASRVEERYIRQYCRAHHLKLLVAHWSKNRHPRHGVENAARKFRYRFFKKVMWECEAPVLLTAHHLNDQAETLLMRLIRGGDLDELMGIHQVRSFAGGRLIRPLLRISKKQIRWYAKIHQIKYYQDQTNFSLKMTRNRMRHCLLPQLKKENPRILEHLSNYAIQLTRLIRENHRLLQYFVKMLQKNNSENHYYQLADLQVGSLELQYEIMHRLFDIKYPELMITPPMLREIVQLLNDSRKPQGTIQINQKLALVKVYRKFKIQPLIRRVPKLSYLKVVLNRWYRIDQFHRCKIRTTPLNSKCVKQFSLENEDFPLIIRSSRPSDCLRLKNGGHQKVRRVWINQKLSNQERRASQVLVTHRGLVLSLLGYKSAFIPLNNRNIQCFLVVKRDKRGSIDE